MFRERLLFVAGTAACLFYSATAAATGTIGELSTVALFDAQAAETPESVASDFQGNLYVSMALTGEIRKIAPDGTQSTLAFLPVGVAPPGSLFPGIMGALTVRYDGTVFVSLASAELALKGVWKVSPEGDTELLSVLPPDSLPNGIALRLGKLYVADSALGKVWRVPVNGGAAEVWVDDADLLRVPGPIAIAPGANGIQFFQGEAYVCNSSSSKLWAYEINWFGQLGDKRLHAENVPCDDFDFDVSGNAYVTTDPFQTLLVVYPDGSQDTLFTVDDLLDGPTACAFGRTLSDSKTLYISNAAFPFFPNLFRPSVMKVEMPLPGWPRWPL